MIKFCVTYAGAPALTNRLGIKIHKAAERKKPM